MKRPNFFILNRILFSILFLFVFEVSIAQCVPTGMQSWNNFNISNVWIQGEGASQINNYTGSSDVMYNDYSSMSTVVVIGSTYNVTIDHIKETWGPLKVKMWIDYQGDGTYVEVYDSGGYVNNGNATAVTNASFTVSNAAISGTSILRIAASYHDGAITDACTFVRRAEIEDYTLFINPVSATPIARDNEMSVVRNSTAGTANQVNVAANDYVGTTGGDGNDYSLLASPTNGTVTEVSDGVFQYIPNSGYVGNDSFTYNLCNNINQCQSATVSVTVLYDYAEPNAGSNGTRFITNVTMIGETVNINNNSSDGGGYESFTNVPAADLYLGNSYDLSILIGGNTNINAGNHRSGWVAYIDYNQDGIFDDGNERVYRSGGPGGGEESDAQYPYVSRSIPIPFSATEGVTTMRIGLRQYWSPNSAYGETGGNVLDYEDYKVKITLDPFAPQDIVVSGNNTEIINGQTVTSYSSFTDFGTYDLNGGAKTRVFTVYNNGSQDLVFGANPVALQGGSSADFSVLSQPTALTALAPGHTETFSINFDPSTINNNIAAVVVVRTNDPDEDPFTFNIVGEGQELYPDTDGDGVSNNIDIDDDNDGIADGEEQLQCLMYSNAAVVETEFLNETFGVGVNRSAINGNTDGVTTSYCYEDGASGQTPDECDGDVNLNDGEYTVHYSITNGEAGNNGVSPNGENIATFGHYAWYKGGDHTPGDTDGKMAIFNAATDPGVFYETAISGVLPNVPVNYSFWAINIDNADNRFSAGELPRINPNITVKFLTSDYTTELASYSTGDITRCASGNGCVDSIWKEYGTSVTVNESEFVIQFINNSPGGLGNDLALDDIVITQSLCDLDHDGVADVFDLDNDNDGIPNIYEYGALLQGGDTDKDGLVASGIGWLDANGNGMHDAYENASGLDTDNDGTPDYIDLDSDNDSIFDVVENDGNGDLDINGDGVGNGIDAGTGIANDDFDDDGILALIDNNDDDADANDQGAGINGYAFPKDTDGDGIPDYLDVDSNDAGNDPSNGTDISDTIYTSLDADGDGVIDGNADVDLDGILDTFDTDNTFYGSPRDLENSYSLFFDGRNDYVEDTNVISSGKATIMAWIKSEGDNTLNTDRVVAGQKNFYIVVNDADNTVSLMLNGTTVITSTDVVVDAIWTHVAAATSTTETVLYINGEAQAASLTNGGVSYDIISKVTIGRLPDTDSNYFHGEIDEVRLFNSTLSETEIQRTVYQELEENESFNQGKIIPKDISTANIGANLVRYYKMDGYKDDITDNKVTPAIDQSTGAKLYNIKKIYFQTAPLPYKTIQDGEWTTVANWQHGDVWDITDVANNKDWSIVQLHHNISTTASHANVGLFIDNNKTFTINGDNEVNNSWYFQLDGTLDLQKDSQLIQKGNSDLVTSASGKILRRQEGTSDYYWYNYWGSPVGATGITTLSDNNTSSNNTNNTPFKINMLKDGDGNGLSFTNANNQIGALSTRWMYTYKNGVTYYDYESLRTTTAINSGVGYIHKGTGEGTEQEYIFEGKPNNGTIKLSVLDAGGAGSVAGVSKTEYILGNPYPSALDVRQFIDDNQSVLQGDIHLWQQWAGVSHTTTEYEGGYAVVNKTGSILAYQFEGGIGGNNGSLDGTKRPTWYLPIGQGFVVEITNDGSVEFNNNQRIFIKENDADGTVENGSVFFREATQDRSEDSEREEDVMQKIRIEFNALDGQPTRRELLLGFSDFTTDGYDYGYESKNTEDNHDDLSLLLEDEYMLIQAYGAISEDKVVPLALKTSGSNSYSINLTEVINIADEQEIYLRDNLRDVYFDLRDDAVYTFISEAGQFDERFEIVFEGARLSTEEVTANNNAIIYFNSNQNLLYAKQLKEDVASLVVHNVLGQNVYTKENVKVSDLESGISLENTSTGVYLVTMKTKSNATITKKIIIQ